MFNERERIYLAQERHKELLRIAEHERLIRRIRAGRRQRAKPFYGPALGQQLIAWGLALARSLWPPVGMKRQQILPQRAQR